MLKLQTDSKNRFCIAYRNHCRLDIFHDCAISDRTMCVDSGIGISREDMQHVFDRFFRSDPARGRESGGTGLGLAIAKWIVDAHGGHFEVLSRENLGTRMTVCLPVGEAEKAA